MNSRALLALTLPFVFSMPCYASDDAEGKPLSAEVSLGALNTSGNTESTAYTGKMDLKHEMANWRTNYILTGLYKENETTIEQVDGSTREEMQVSAERYYGSAQADYKLNEEHRGLFVFASYEEDKFGNFEYQGTLAAGYTDRLFKTDVTEFNYSVGPGMSYSKTTETLNDDGSVKTESISSESPIVRLAADFKWDISENSSFRQTLASDYAPSSDDNTKTRAETSLLSKINSSFSMKLSYTITNNSVVEDGVENTDTETAASLVYSY
ncbi:Putative salt-induced outer membrane protein YdiY [Alteromonadaceae bacterium Bs31]|nr:Putative salt-induced outer membrane protein YdiY [Alteromonadaceae bacterium Bs31]